MAELAVGALILGAAYIASNQKNGNLMTQEGLTNMGRTKANYLPNTTIPTTNYPVNRPETGSNVNDYANPNTPTDRYYARNVDLSFSEPAISHRINFDGFPERISINIWPEHIHKNHLGIDRLPWQKVRGSLFA